MTADYVPLLAELDLFAGLPADQVQNLAMRSHVSDHPAGRTIPADGSDGLALHLLLSGEAAVIVDGSTDHGLRVGDYFGEISMLDGQPRSAVVAAITPVTTLVVPATAVRELAGAEAVFAARLLALLCARLRAVDASI